MTNAIVERAYKTFIEVSVAQAALYRTVSPQPKPATTAAVSLGATAVSVLWNGLILWWTTIKSARLDKLAEAIDQIVDARLAAQHIPDPPSTP